MEAREEREFLKQDVQKLKGSTFLKKLGVFEKLAIFLFDITCFLFKKIYTDSTKSSRTIIIVSLHRLGDTVFTIPAIKELFNFYPNYKIYIICFPETRDIYNIQFEEKCLVTISKSEFKISRRIASPIARNTIRKLNPEIIFDITGTPSSASLIWDLKTRDKVGMNIRYFKNLYSTYTPIRNSPHFMDLYLDVVKQRVPIRSKAGLYQFASKIDKAKRILIHPFAIRKAKEWNLAKFLRLTENLLKKYCVELIIPPEFLKDDIIDEIYNRNIPTTVTKNVKELIDKIRECSVFISNDSGPIHIANLLGKATYTIFGPTNPKFSLPGGEHHQFIHKSLPCTHFETKVCHLAGGINCSSNECMNTLSVKQVNESIIQFLEDLEIVKRNSIIS